jgi:hypothetical protein
MELGDIQSAFVQTIHTIQVGLAETLVLLHARIQATVEWNTFVKLAIQSVLCNACSTRKLGQLHGFLDPVCPKLFAQEITHLLV